MRPIPGAMVQLNFPVKTVPCRTLLDVWLAARRDDLAPPRSAIDPLALKPVLPHISIYRVVAPDNVQIHLSGTAYREIFGFEPTGRNLLEVTPPGFRRTRAWRFHVGVSHPCGALVELAITYGAGVPDKLEFLSLPLAEAQGQPPMTICAIASVAGRDWQNAPQAQVIAPPSDFRFLDIGAGVPASAFPPDDFLPEWKTEAPQA